MLHHTNPPLIPWLLSLNLKQRKIKARPVPCFSPKGKHALRFQSVKILAVVTDSLSQTNSICFDK